MRVSIARALVTEPDLLLMDEPFGALDEIHPQQARRRSARLWWERKLPTVVFVTHSIYEAVFLSTRIVVMAAHPGRIFEEHAHRRAAIRAPRLPRQRRSSPPTASDLSGRLLRAKRR